jgi:hypothetical protein
MMLSDYPPSASAMVQQATSLGSIVVTTENKNPSTIPLTSCQTGQRGNTHDSLKLVQDRSWVQNTGDSFNLT